VPAAPVAPVRVTRIAPPEAVVPVATIPLAIAPASGAPAAIAPVGIAPIPDSDYGLRLSSVTHVREVTLGHWKVGEPGDDEVTIRVKASAINFPDTMCVRGLYPTMPEYPFVPGFEVAGVISRVGAKVSGYAVGDDVVALTGAQMGGHASAVNVPEKNLIRKPARLSFEDACSLPIVFGTVFYAFELGRLAPREHVLVQTATGGCGLMALQLAALKDAVCYGTSSRDENSISCAGWAWRTRLITRRRNSIAK